MTDDGTGQEFPTMQSKAKTNRGPTLIEVVTALAIIAAFIIGAYAP